MNGTAAPPQPPVRGAALVYVLIPFLVLTLTGIVAAAVMYVRRKQRMDRLRHRLLPVYAYDPSEERSEAEHELTWRGGADEGWRTTSQQWWPLLPKDPDA